jgi:hypothetical protein
VPLNQGLAQLPLTNYDSIVIFLKNGGQKKVEWCTAALLSHNRAIDEQNIMNLHRLFYKHIDSDNAGNYRTKAVIIS